MPDKEEKRCVIEYRTKGFENGAKWSLCFQRVIEKAIDSPAALKQFWADPIWTAQTGTVEVKAVLWLD